MKVMMVVAGEEIHAGTKEVVDALSEAKSGFVGTVATLSWQDATDKQSFLAGCEALWDFAEHQHGAE